MEEFRDNDHPEAQAKINQKLDYIEQLKEKLEYYGNILDQQNGNIVGPQNTGQNLSKKEKARQKITKFNHARDSNEDEEEAKYNEYEQQKKLVEDFRNNPNRAHILQDKKNNRNNGTFPQDTQLLNTNFTRLNGERVSKYLPRLINIEENLINETKRPHVFSVAQLQVINTKILEIQAVIADIKKNLKYPSKIDEKNRSEKCEIYNPRKDK